MSLLTILEPNMSHQDLLVYYGWTKVCVVYSNLLVCLRNRLMRKQQENLSVNVDVDLSHYVEKSGASRRVSWVPRKIWQAKGIESSAS
jgi:hypothetical protein